VKICIKIGAQLHCYPIPIIEFPVTFHHPGPGPVNYPQLLQDALLLTSLQAAAKNIADTGVRGAIDNGIGVALKALAKRGGEHISIDAGAT